MGADENWGEPRSDSDPQRVGPYLIRGRLGAGAMGRVYLGQADDGSYAAVKVVRADLADIPVFRSRFARELKVVRKISGPRVARVLDADADAAQPWIATERVLGPSLQELVESGGPLDVRRLRMLARDIAVALRDIHAAEVVHRDLKPSNVLLAADGPKVIDFGVAHTADATNVLTNTGHTPGTPAYMSPEQAEAKAVVPATDVFALGSLLAFAATGRLAFGDGPPLAVLNRVVNGRPDLAGVADGDAELQKLIRACLSRSPEKRPTPERIIEICGGGGGGGEDGPAGVPVVGVAAFLETQRISGPGGSSVSATDPTTSTAPRRISGKRIGVGAGVLAAVIVVLVATLVDGSSGGGTRTPGRQAAAAAHGGGFPSGDGDPSSSVFGGTAGPASGSVSGPVSGPGSPNGGSPGGASPGASSPGQIPNPNPAPSPSRVVVPTSAPPPKQPTTTLPAPPKTTQPAPPSTSQPASPTPVPANQPPAPPATNEIGVYEPAYFGTATIQVSWKAHADATSYDVHYMNGSDHTDKIVNATGTSTTFDFVPAGSRVCLWVRTVNQYGASAWTAAPTGCFTA